MTETKISPTPGPYRIESTMGHGTSVVAGPWRVSVAWFPCAMTTAGGGHSIGRFEARANAKLFIIAPIMRDALELIARSEFGSCPIMHGTHDWGKGRFNDLRTIARVALGLTEPLK